MVLRTGEVLQPGAVRASCQRPDINLQTVAQPETDLVVTLGQYLLDARETKDLLNQRCPQAGINAARPSDKDIEVTHSFPAAAQRTGWSDGINAVDFLQVRRQLLGNPVHFIDQEAARNAAVIFNCLEDLLLAFGAQAGEGLKLAFLCQFFHSLNIADVEGAPDQCYGLGAQALNLEQLEHRGIVLLAKLLVELQLAGGDQFLDVGGHSLADTGDRHEILGFAD